MKRTPGERPADTARPARATALLYGIAGGALILAAMLFFLPVNWKEGQLRYRLWRSGARSVLWEKHRGFVQDRCAGASPAACECIWLLHGMGDSVVTWRNVFLDREAFGELRVRIFAIDLPGHGGSLKRRDPAEYRVTNIARELDAEIAKTSECTRNALVGNSFGGWVAARMAHDFPARYERLVLLSPTGLSNSASAGSDLLQAATIESLKEFQRRAYFKPRTLTDGEWAAAAERMKAGSSDAVQSAQTPEDRLDERLREIKPPTTVIWGEADRVVPRAEIDRFVKEIPAAGFAAIPECGHLPQKECPAKLFPLIRRALSVPHSAP